MQKKQTTVRGQSIIVYSADGARWFSDLAEARSCEKRRQKFLAERAKSLRRSPALDPETTDRHRW
jgi:hypothetical protein